jgi:Putative beta-lactamase-inhibitor-like, PepSY-like
MKKIMLLGLVCLLSSLAHAQKPKEIEVPAAVKTAFAKRFPQAKKVEWSMENASEYEAEYELSGTEQASNFDASGNWLVTETEIKKSELPSSVQAAIAKQFAGYKIEEPEKGETSDIEMFYEVELAKGKIKYEVQFSPDGKVLKKEEIEKKGEDKD